MAIESDAPRTAAATTEPSTATRSLRVLVASVAAITTVVAGAAALYWLPSRAMPFYTKGEPREAIVMQSILTGPSVVAPLRNGDEIPSKPPLFHWLGAAASAPSGAVTELSARAPSIAAALLGVACAAALGVQMFGLSSGVIGAAMLATSVVWLQAATAARVDMVLAGLLTVAMVTFLVCYRANRRPLSQIFYAACACAVLTKGPVGVILPGAVIAVFLLYRRDLAYIGRMRIPVGLVWMLLPIAWYVWARIEIGPAFTDKLLLKENVYRVLDPEAVEAGHVKPFYEYVPLLLAGFAPWSFFLPASLLDLWKHRTDARWHDAAFLVAWVVVPFVLFSMAGSKRAVYLLPTFPALALLVGHWWALTAAESRADGKTTGPGALWSVHVAAAFLALPALLVLIEVAGLPVATWVGSSISEGDRANLAAALKAIADSRLELSLWGFSAIALAVLADRMAARGRWVLTLVMMLALLASTIGALTTVFERAVARTQTLKPFMHSLVADNPTTPMFFYGGFDYGAIFYARRPIPRIDTLDAIVDRPRAIVLTWQPELAAVERACSPPACQSRELAHNSYDDNPRRDTLIALELTFPPQPIEGPQPLEPQPDAPQQEAPEPQASTSPRLHPFGWVRTNLHRSTIEP